MKNRERETLHKNKTARRIASGVLCAALVGTGVGAYAVWGNESKGTVLAAVESGSAVADLSEATDSEKEQVLTTVLDSETSSDSDAQKEETVYVVSDATGAQQKVIVSDWLKNPSDADVISDASDLTDIKNVKGDETFTQSGDGTITWEANGNDIYYQGTTDKELPVEMKITYTLDGKTVTPEEIAGQSGKVTIRMDYTNKETFTTEINGKTEEMSVPFTAITGMILGDSFQNVTVKNGKVISDGKNQVVVGIAMPGLTDSLQLSDLGEDVDLEIPEYVEVSADVTDFSLDMTLTMIMSDVLSDINLDQIDYSEQADTLKNAVNEYVTGVNSLKDGVASYTEGAKKVSDGITSLKSGADTLSAGVQKLVSAIGTINSYFTGENGLLSGATKLAAGVNQLDLSLNTAMSDAQKQQVESQAEAAVEQQFAAGMKDTIANQASAQFVSAIKGAKDTLGTQLCSSELYTTLVEATYQQKVFAAYQKNKDDIDNKIAYYQSLGQSVTIADVVEAIYKQQTGSTLRSAVEAGVTTQLKDSVAPTILNGIAEYGKTSMGDSVAAACKSAAVTAAKSAVVQGAEGAKQQIATQIEEGGLVSGATALADGIDQIYTEGLSPLQSGMDELSGKLPALTSGVLQLYNGATELVSNNDALNSGAKTLADATNELAQTYEDKAEPVLNRLSAIVDAGQGYHTFTKLADGMDGSVKFIIRTEAVSAEEE